jgi:hypothetical protein
MTDYRTEMASFYGLVDTTASDVVSLTTEAQAASATTSGSSQVHRVTTDVFRACAPSLRFADKVTHFGDTVQQAFDRHASEMGMSTGREIVAGAPSLPDGVKAADVVDDYSKQAQDLLHDCGSDGRFAKDVAADSGAYYCIQAADAKMSALQHAQDLGDVVRQHQEIMQQYEDGSITARQRDEMGAPSLEQGAAAANAFRQDEDKADHLVSPDKAGDLVVNHCG